MRVLLYVRTQRDVFGQRSPAALSDARIARVGKRPANVGAFIYVNRPRAHELAVQLRVRDLSRQAESWGTEVPVVRDREMLTATAHLLDIPVRSDFRSHLRVYGASSPSGLGDVRVRFYANNDMTPLEERILTLVQAGIGTDLPPSSLPADHERPAVLAYAELADLAKLLTPGFGDSFRLEITPLTPGLKYWAMVSVTNNVTQHVTLITPQ